MYCTLVARSEKKLERRFVLLKHWKLRIYWFKCCYCVHITFYLAKYHLRIFTI